jgi:hypothetical protein
MHWLQDLVLSVLFPYLLPSLPVYEEDGWPANQFRSILEYLLISLCHINSEDTRDVLETFIRRTFSILRHEISLDNDLEFLANIQKRSTFGRHYKFKSEAYSFYATSFLIENKADIHFENDYALRDGCKIGHTRTVALLLEQKADIHVSNDYGIRLASKHGHKDIVALLIQHKADIHAEDNDAVRLASGYGHKDVVALLLEHKADLHAEDGFAVRSASSNGHTDVVALLLEHKADVHAKNDSAISMCKLL